ncbi:TPA: PEP-CTERM sorting domain-containing protein [Candidatus Poribacteria bacterium]|nr:PEP-CTERM sorting domain-containing protein [Candidatus Poribacteria bacterium]
MRCYAVLGACLLRWEITRRFVCTAVAIPEPSGLLLLVLAIGCRFARS